MNTLKIPTQTVKQTGRKQFTHNFKNDLIGGVPTRSIETGMYHAAGKEYPGITRVLSILSTDDIAAWKQRIGQEEADRISRKSALRGTKFHTYCENYLTNKFDPFWGANFDTPLHRQMFINSLDYLNNIDDIHLIETRLWSEHLRIAGTVDCIARYNGKLSVIDFKTAKGEKKEEWIESYFMQAAGYSIMFEERTKIPVANIVIIVAVEGMPTQVFHEKRDNWAKQLLTCRDQYEKIHRAVPSSCIG